MAVMLQNEWDVTVYVSGCTWTHYSCSKVLLKHKQRISCSILTDLFSEFWHEGGGLLIWFLEINDSMGKTKNTSHVFSCSMAFMEINTNQNTLLYSASHDFYLNAYTAFKLVYS